MAMANPTPTPIAAPERDARCAGESWELVVWNDEVNLFTYVVYVLQHRLQLSYEQAEKLTYQIHHHGSAVALRAARSEVEARCQALHISGIQATVRAA